MKKICQICCFFLISASIFAGKLELDDTTIKGEVQLPQADFILKNAEVKFDESLGFFESFNFTKLIVDSVSDNIF